VSVCIYFKNYFFFKEVNQSFLFGIGLLIYFMLIASLLFDHFNRKKELCVLVLLGCPIWVPVIILFATFVVWTKFGFGP
jgi:hypothetical protein